MIPPPPAPSRDTTPPTLVVEAPDRLALAAFLRDGLRVELRVDEPARLDAALAAVPHGRLGGGRPLAVDAVRARVEQADELIVTLRARGRARLLLRLARRAEASLEVRAADRAGNGTTRRVRIALR